MGRQGFVGFYVLKDKTWSTIKGDVKNSLGFLAFILIKALYYPIYGVIVYYFLCHESLNYSTGQ